MAVIGSNGKVTSQEIHVAIDGSGQFTSIQAAINAAAASTPAPSATAPYTVLVHSGVYTEAVVCAAYVSIKGFGSRKACVIQQNDATVLTLASNISVRMLTFRLVAPAAARNIVIDNGAAVTGTRITDCAVEITTPGNFTHNEFLFSGASVIDMMRVLSIITGTGASSIVNVTGAATISVWYCEIENQSTSATCTVLSVSNAGAIVDCEFACMLSPYGISVSCSAGIVLLRTCQYNNITRSATGNIMDTSPFLTQAPWHTIAIMWEAIAANENMTRTTAVAGAITDGGTGQIVLSVTNANGSHSSISDAALAAGGLATSFNAARTPLHYVQFSTDVFQANNTMFFGLRQTVGSAIPTTENHCGFEWDGANFKVSNGDGAVQTATNITTPSTAAQHRLEIWTYGSIKIEFYVDGKLVNTSTTHLPTGEMFWQEETFNTGASAGNVRVSVRRLVIRECPA